MNLWKCLKKVIKKSLEELMNAEQKELLAQMEAKLSEAQSMQ